MEQPSFVRTLGYWAGTILGTLLIAYILVWIWSKLFKTKVTKKKVIVTAIILYLLVSVSRVASGTP